MDRSKPAYHPRKGPQPLDFSASDEILYQRLLDASSHRNRLEQMVQAAVGDDARTERLSPAMGKVARKQWESGKSEDAMRLTMARVRLLRAMADRHPGRQDILCELARILNDAGEFEPDPLRANKYAKEQVEICRRLVALKPESRDYRGHLAEALNSHAIAAGTLNLEREAYEEALGIARNLLKEAPDDPDSMHLVSRQLGNLGQLLQESGDLVLARVYFEEAHSLQLRVLGTTGDPIQEQRNLAVKLSNLGRVAFESGDMTEARFYLKEACDVLSGLVCRNPGRADLREELSIAEEDLQDLDEGAV